MCDTAAGTGLTVHDFEARHSAIVAGWVRTDQDLLWLAPSAVPPLTAEKVAAWVKPDGAAYIGCVDNHEVPTAYGEINPMRGQADHVWFGHIIVDPTRRNQGVGRRFILALLELAWSRFAANHVSLVVFPANLGAILCYQRCGFGLVGEEYHRFGNRGLRHRLVRLTITKPPSPDRPS